MSPSMGYKAERRLYTFPIVVPSVTQKASILHEDFGPVWLRAAEALREADRIITFGYSCPPSDNESANLITRSIRQNGKLKSFVIIDPSPETFARYVLLTGLDKLTFYRTAKAYLNDSSA